MWNSIVLFLYSPNKNHQRKRCDELIQVFVYDSNNIDCLQVESVFLRIFYVKSYVTIIKIFDVL